MGFYEFIKEKELFPAEGQKGVVICPLDAQVGILAGHWLQALDRGGRQGRIWEEKGKENRRMRGSYNPTGKHFKHFS